MSKKSSKAGMKLAQMSKELRENLRCKITASRKKGTGLLGGTSEHCQCMKGGNEES